MLIGGCCVCAGTVAWSSWVGVRGEQLLNLFRHYKYSPTQPLNTTSWTCLNLHGPGRLMMQRSSRSPLPPQAVHLRHTRSCDNAVIRFFASTTASRSPLPQMVDAALRMFCSFSVHVMCAFQFTYLAILCPISPLFVCFPIAQEVLCVMT